MVLELYPSGLEIKREILMTLYWDVAQLMNILKSKKDILVQQLVDMETE